MFVGVIKTRDVLCHPVTIIRMMGLKGYTKLFFRALSTKHYQFITMAPTDAEAPPERKKSQKH